LSREKEIEMARIVLGMLGLGTVGGGVVRLLSHQKNLTLKMVAVRDLNKPRQLPAKCSLTSKAEEVIKDPEIEIIVEVMGGEEPATSLIKQALKNRKHVVTANKEVLAKHGPELFALAKEMGVTIFFEAAVAGGVPLISTIHKGLEANELSSVIGILNGTTNYILSSMDEQGTPFKQALEKAQELGFAEQDASYDIEGHDVAYKLSIVSALAFGCFIEPKRILREGIQTIGQEDIKLAKEFGYKIKLIGSVSTTGTNGNSESLDARVHPMLVPMTHPLANVTGSNNGILLQGKAVDEIAMVGPGAGQMPTASAVVGDIINLSSALQLPDFASYFHPDVAGHWANVAEPGDWTCPYFVRIIVKDTPGVIGQIGTIFGSNEISIQSLLQRGAKNNQATLVVITHECQNRRMTKALEDLKACDFTDEIASCIRIFRGHL
jgi:homoserine dehydrogenase